MKNIKKRLLAGLASAVAVLSIVPTMLSAAAPYATYTYAADSQRVLTSPAAYVPDQVIDSTYMGLEVAFDDPRDLFIGPDQKMYLVDAAGNRVLVCDRYYKFQFEISSFTNEHGVPDSFNNPSGVFVTEDYIYVCDTDNNRIVMFDTEGEYVKIIKKPESNLFEEGSIYKPVACAVDQYGRLFVVSSTTYQGIIVINDNADFFGFIGAQKVAIGALEILWRKIQTDEQRAQSEEYVSTEFNNITIDEDNFIYVTTSSIDETNQQNAIWNKSTSSDYAPVKKLNASGADVMKRTGFWPPSGEVSISNLSTSTITGASKIIDAAVGPEGTWSIIDEKRSKVFTYDDNGNLLFVFGDIGNQIGNAQSVEAIAYQGSKILLLDKTNDNIIVYRRTEYGDMLLQALEHDNNRMYDKTIEDWTEILKRNNNFDNAYIQIGKALYRQGKYEEAMEYYKAAYETTNYSLAYKEIRKEWASSNFWMIPVVIVVACILIAKFFGYAAKVNKRAALKMGRKSLKEELLYAMHIIFHPFDGFWDLKHEKRGSVRSGFVILIITIVAYFYASIGKGYIFNPRTSYADVFGSITAVIAPLLLWVVANWCLTTLFEGEGSMGDIFTAACYSLTPLPIIITITTLCTNFLAANEGGIVTMLNSFAYIWLGILLVIGMMSTHDYSVAKNILTCLATIVGMAFIMFLGILFSSLVGKIIMFVVQIVEEISYRM